MAFTSYEAMPLDQMLNRVQKYHPGDGYKLVEKAWKFAEKAHEGQVRKSGEPYFTHPCLVASILTDLMIDPPTIAAGLLHDTVEDCEGITLDTIREKFGEEVKRRILIGNCALSAGYYDAYYLKALKVRRLIKEDYDRAFEKVDVIVTPTAPTPAYRIGEMTSDPLKMYLQDIYTVPLNLAGLPGISVPCGYSSSKLPIGLQIIGKPLDEATVLRAAYTYEQSQTFYKDMAETEAQV